MANQDLLNKTVEIPDEILSFLNQATHMFNTHRDDKGYKRAKFLLKNQVITYQELKRIKNYFDTLSDNRINTPEFFLNGGNIMAKWVNQVLSELRDKSRLQKQAKKDAGESNSFKDEKSDKNDYKPAKIRKADIARLDTNNEFSRNSMMNEEINKILKLSNYGTT